VQDVNLSRANFEEDTEKKVALLLKLGPVEESKGQSLV